MQVIIKIMIVIIIIIIIKIIITILTIIITMRTKIIIIIMINIQDTDKTVRVECAFTAEDQTVSFRPTAGGRDDGGGISVT